VLVFSAGNRNSRNFSHQAAEFHSTAVVQFASIVFRQQVEPFLVGLLARRLIPEPEIEVPTETVRCWHEQPETPIGRRHVFPQFNLGLLIFHASEYEWRNQKSRTILVRLWSAECR
jgi:hypothetical protein